jgi:hypothetical protein
MKSYVFEVVDGRLSILAKNMDHAESILASEGYSLAESKLVSVDGWNLLQSSMRIG